ncbi:MAG: hypothetical protein K8S54_14440 [Spirochaetia bacterium]|nr:hypothetical protein [Spirochaetia bacterium]
MKLILFALAVTLLYQFCRGIMARVGRPDIEPPGQRKPVFRIVQKKPGWEKDITHRSRILDEDSRPDR